MLIESIQSKGELNKIIYSLEYQNERAKGEMQAYQKQREHDSKLYQLQMKERGLLLRMLSDETNKLRIECEYYKKKAIKTTTEKIERKVKICDN